MRPAPPRPHRRAALHRNAATRAARLERWAWAGAIGLGAAAAASAQTVAAVSLDEMSLEQLREVVVMTVSRTPEQLDRAAASVYVISAEDIRRSGVTTIPEALRLAPSLNVARADSNQYAISARGFNNVLANKMLVLIDGRTVYTPLFSGVFWEAQDVMLEAVERIEVVTGPSTALWGSNAVNGLIHIITRSAAATQQAAGSVSIGERHRGASVRVGMPLGSDGHLRAYAKGYNRDASRRADGLSVNDQADGVQAGFRADWSRSGDSVTVQGDVYTGTIDPAPAARKFSGGNVTARVERVLEPGSTAELQVFLERTERHHPQTFAETLDTADVVAQYTLQPAADHRVLVGAGYRHSRDRVAQFAALAFVPPLRDMSWRRLFAQDQVALSPTLALTLAASLESNPFTGSALLPSARLAWQIDAERMAWTSLARAARAPSRVDREYFQPAQPPFLVAGGPNFRSERADVFELGYRHRPSTTLSYAATFFYQRHSRLRSLSPTPVGLQFENNIRGWSRGLEAWARWRPADAWRLDAGLQVLQKRLSVVAGTVDAGGLPALGNDPRYAWSLRSALDVTPALSWDVSVRHVAALPNPQVPAYTAVDTRATWAATPTLEVALGVQNLLDRRHAEWGAAPNRVEVERELSLRLRWRL